MTQEPMTEDPRVPLARHRTKIADFRTQLAMDRTTLAWIRTTLSIAGFGFGMVGFFRTLEERHNTPESVRLHHSAIHFGTSLIVLGLVATVLASISHLRALRRLRQGEAPVLTLWPLSIMVALCLAILGLIGLWKLLT